MKYNLVTHSSRHRAGLLRGVRSVALLILLGVSALSVETVHAQSAAPRTLWNATDVSLQRGEDGSHFTVNVMFHPGEDLRSQEVVCLYPYLESADGKQHLTLSPVVAFAGARRYKVLGRLDRLGNWEGSELQREEKLSFEDILPADGASSRGLTRTVPFEPWMRDAILRVKAVLYGCASCEVSESVTELGRVDLPHFTEADYVFHFYEVPGVAVKRYEEQFECKVNFVVARHELRRDFKGNASELDRLDHFVSQALELARTGATLESMQVYGYASPEGGFDYNKALAGRRANVLADYVRSHHENVRRLATLSVEGVGEDWEGLRRAVEASSMEHKEEVLAAIDGHDTDVAREREIKALDGGRVYRYLLDNLYPPLRRTTFKMGYKVRPYTVDELPQIFEKNPGLMSHSELCLLAQEYAKKGQSPVPVYAVAYQRFSCDILSTLNYANALLKYERNADRALELLLPIRESEPRALLPIAIAYHMKGDRHKCEEALKRAADAGVQEAIPFR